MIDGLQEFWFEEFFNSGSHAVWVLDPHGKVVEASCAALELAGVTKNVAVGIPFWLVPWPGISSQDRKALKLVINQVSRGKPAVHEFEIKPRSRPQIALSIALKPILSAEHELAFIFVEGHDVTMYRRASDALTESEARSNTIFRNIGVGILVKGVNGKVLDCNPAFESMVGYTAAELSRLNYLTITHPDDKRMSRKLFNELVSGKRDRYSLEKRYIHKNGQPVWASVTASLVLGSQQQAQFVIVMVENITLKKEIENELDELHKRLLRGREMERLQIAQELHDGPLQELIGISFQFKSLNDPPLETSDREQLEDIQLALEQLTISLRTICGELRPPTLVPFGLEKTIKSHAQQVRDAHPELAISLDLVEDGQSLSEPVRIILFRIYQEAVNNILRHAHARQVKVRFRLQAERAVLVIQDNGVGFVLPDRWITLARQGHLGIVGAQERAREIGGSLEIRSRPGRGTLLRVEVPIVE